MSYKVFRLIEYTYPDARSADSDMKRWGVPPVGGRDFGPSESVRSTIIQYPGDAHDANNHTV